MIIVRVIVLGIFFLALAYAGYLVAVAMIFGGTTI
jgi:hypothetical protein